MIFGASSQRLGFGASALGGLYSEVGSDAARATVDAAWRVGIRHFDAAPLYGSGLAEKRLGAAALAFVEPGAVDTVLLAGRYTLLDRSAGNRLLPLCAERGVPVVAGAVFNSGLLAGESTFEYREADREILARRAELETICTRYDVPLAAAALQFPLQHEAVVSVVVGARSPQEIEEDVRLCELPLPDALWAELEAA